MLLEANVPFLSITWFIRLKVNFEARVRVRLIR